MHARNSGTSSNDPGALPPSRLKVPPPEGLALPAGAKRPWLPLGRIVATPAALVRIPPEEIANALVRHQNRDWGNVSASDHLANDQALREGTRILSAYRSAAGDAFWILTEADRSVTTVLLPEDY